MVRLHRVTETGYILIKYRNNHLFLLHDKNYLIGVIRFTYFNCRVVIIRLGDSCGWATRDFTVTPLECSPMTLEIHFGAGSYMGSGEDAWLVVGVISFLPVLVANKVI